MLSFLIAQRSFYNSEDRRYSNRPDYNIVRNNFETLRKQTQSNEIKITIDKIFSEDRQAQQRAEIKLQKENELRQKKIELQQRKRIAREKIIKENEYILFSGKIFQHIDHNLILAEPESIDIVPPDGASVIYLSLLTDEAKASLLQGEYDSESFDEIKSIVPDVQLYELPKISEELIVIEFPKGHFGLQRPDGRYLTLIVQKTGLYQYQDIYGALRTVSKYRVVSKE